MSGLKGLSGRDRFIVKTTLIYGGVAALWIELSDAVLAGRLDAESMLWLSKVKGLGFVVVTTILLALVLRSVPDAQARPRSGGEDGMAPGAGPGPASVWAPIPCWLVYGATAALSVAMLALREAMATFLGEGPHLILFMFPVLLAGATGGLGPGLFATLIVSLGAAFLALSPVGRPWEAAPHDLLYWAFLVANGVLASLLGGWLRRSRRRALDLREFERNFRVLFDDVATSIQVHDRHTGEIVAANRRALAVTGCASLEELRAADPWAEPPYSFEDALVQIRATALEGARRMEWKRRDRQGRVFWEDALLQPLTFANVERVVAIAIDITERKNAEAEKHRLGEALRQSAQPVLLTDTEFRITFVNQAFVQLMGYGEEELLGMSIDRLCPQDKEEPDRQRDIVRRVREGAQWSGEVPRLARNGATIPLHANVAAIRDRDGRFIGLIADYLDLRPMKERERELRESEERLRLVFEITDDGLWDWDLGTGQTLFNDRYWNMAGFEPGEVEADVNFFKSLIHPDDVAAVMDIMTAHLQGRIADSVIEYRMLTRTGEVKWIHGHGRVVKRAPSGAALRMLGAITDITERKSAEQALQRQEEELRQRNEELERFNRAMVGRELMMIELKGRINALSLELGREPPFPSHVLDPLDMELVDMELVDMELVDTELVDAKRASAKRARTREGGA